MEKQWRWTSPSLYNSWDLNLYWQSILTPQEMSKKQNQLVRNWRLKVSSPKNISGTHAKHGIRAETNEQNKAVTGVSPPYVPRRIKVTFSLFLCCWYLCCAWCFCKSVLKKNTHCQIPHPQETSSLLTAKPTTNTKKNINKQIENKAVYCHLLQGQCWLHLEMSCGSEVQINTIQSAVYWAGGGDLGQ